MDTATGSTKADPVVCLSCQHPDRIFVFGSNEAGRHGAGAARHALTHHGAKYGVGFGLQGWSYAIPTKDLSLHRLPLTEIKNYVDDFLVEARLHPNLMYQVTRIGCGLAGYRDTDIAPLFRDAPANVVLPPGWRTSD